MKKLKLCLLAAMLMGGVNLVFAQKDVTSDYLTNADFSSSTPIASNLNGYGKDGSPYGFQTVDGWTSVVTKADNSNASYPNSGMGGAVFEYGSTYQLQGNKKAAPASGPNGGSGKALGFFGVWGCGGYYYQSVTLNPGDYTLIFPIYNQSGTQENTTYTGFFPTSGTNRTVAVNPAVGSWANQTVSFTLNEATAGEIRIGYQSKGSGSGSNPHIFVDKVTIIYTDFKAELRAVIAQAQAINARISTLGDEISAAQSVLNNASASKTVIDEAVTTLRSAVSTKLGAYTGLDAAGDDITSFIANNGFETSPVFDGTYLGASSSANATPTDGSTLLFNSANVYQVNGWELMTAATSDYARTFTMPYSTTLYVKSNNADGGQAVAAPANGSSVTTDNDNLLFVEANWCENAVLGVKQTIPLPAGSYRLTFDSYVATTLANANSLCGISYGETTNYKWPASTNTWTPNEVDFTLDDQTDVTISMGYKKSGNVGGGNSAFLFIDNVKLTYFDPLKLAQLQWQETWNALDALDEAALPDAAEGVIADALEATEPTTIEGYDEAKAALQALIDSYAGIKAAYDKLNERIEFVEDEVTNSTGTKNTINEALSTARTNKETRTTASDLESDYTALETARQAYVTGAAKPTAGHAFDFTFKINNAAVASTTGWTGTGLKTKSGEQYTGAPDNTYFDCGWNTSLNANQSVAGLPVGFYTLKAATRAKSSEVTEANIYVNQDNTSLNRSTDNHRDNNSGGSLGNGWSWTEVDFQLNAAGSVTVGFYAQTTGQGWAGADDFHLYYKGNIVDDDTANELIATFNSAPMNSEVASAQTSAKNAFEGEKTLENYLLLEAAIAAANTSAEKYAAANTKLEAMKRLVDGTNVYTAEALDTYYTTPKSKYDDRSMTNDEAEALEDPYAQTGNRANVLVDNFLLSAWDSEPDFTAEDSPYYINTWSTEGNNDGSDFKTPFFEYRVTDANSLAERTLTATVTGLKANQDYKVSATTRVRIKNGATGATGITLQVGSSAAADVCNGAQVGSSQFYLKEATAYGKSDEDGVLTVKYNVAAGNNISWLAFQNVVYEEVNVDYAALNAAISRANTVNGTITGGVQALTDAIGEAEGLLTSSDQDEIDAGVDALGDAISAAETTIVARKNLAGVAKKAAALKAFLKVNIDDEVSAAATYAANAEATASEADTKAADLNAYFASWQTVSLANANFDTTPNNTLNNDGTTVFGGTLSTSTANPDNTKNMTANTGDHGYLYDVTGWTQYSKFNSTASQGTTSQYGTAMPANGWSTNSTTIPAADMYGKSEGGALHLSSGWNDQARYVQTAPTLSRGKYVLYYEGFNANNVANALNSNYFGLNGLTAGDLKGTDKTFVYSEEKSFPYNEWKATAFGFELMKDVEGAQINVGIIGGTAGSGSTPKMWFDNLQIYLIEEPTAVTITDNDAAAPAVCEYADVTLNRAFNRGWNALVLPFDADAFAGAEIAEFTGDEGEKDVTVNFKKVSSFEANKPYLVYFPEAVSAGTVFRSVTVNPEEAKTEGTSFDFVGTHVKSEVVKAGDFVISGGKLSKASTAIELKATRTFFQNKTAGAEARSMRFVFDDEEVTGIKAFAAGQGLPVDGIYNLKGQKVERIGNQKGIFVIDGKKIVK